MSWLIRVGDKFIGIDGKEEVVASIWLNDKTVGVESGLAYSYEEVYKSWYEQQKQRADRAEKRWVKLKEHFIKEKEQSFGILSWSRNNGMLELMEQLEEDGE